MDAEAVNEYLGDQKNAFYFEGIRKLEQRWAKCSALKRDYIEKLWSSFHSLVARSTRGQELFDHPSYAIDMYAATSIKAYRA